MRKLTVISWVLSGCTLLSGCGGGGSSSGSIEGLAGPSQISVVAPTSTSSLPSVPGTAGVPVVPLTSDYATDQANTWVYDPSMDSLSIVNEILCKTAATAYPEMVNRGPYNAQINVALCQAGSGGGNNQSSGADQNELEIWVVDSTRASNLVDQIVDFWVPNVDSGVDMGTIYAQMTVSEGASVANPFGSFSLSIAGVPDGGQIADAPLYGYLRTIPGGVGQVGFQFSLVNGDVNQVPAIGDHGEEIAVTVIMSSDLVTGNARIQRRDRRNDSGSGDTGILTSEYLLAFDATHMKRQLDAEAPVVLSRLDFRTSVWRYNLYEASGPDAGKRIERNSGFGFRTLDGQYGNIGYYGLWLPAGVELLSGDTILRQEFGTNNSVPYTVVRSPGKLIHYERNQLTLAELAGEALTWWDYTNGTEYQVECQDPSFFRVATRTPGSDSWDPIAPEEIDVAAAGGYLNMWSPSLGGSVSYVDGEGTVTYYTQTFVNGSDPVFASAVNGTLPLYGLVDCLDADLTAAATEAGTIFLPNAASVAQPHVYRFQQDNLTLYNDADGSGTTLTQTGLADGQVPMSGPYTWGMRSGPLLLDSTGLTNIWDAWSQPEFYIYETGANSWNQYASAVNTQGDAEVFDAPLQFTYTHLVGNDLNDDTAYAGRKFLFGYGGPGNLWGIPSEPADLDGDGNPDRWYPLFALKDGTLVGPTGTEYLVRAIEMEQTLVEDLAGAPGLDLGPASLLELPQISDYVPPDMGPKPVLDTPPAVIDGVVQDG